MTEPERAGDMESILYDLRTMTWRLLVATEKAEHRLAVEPDAATAPEERPSDDRRRSS